MDLRHPSKFSDHKEQLEALAMDLQRIIRDVIGPGYHPDNPGYEYTPSFSDGDQILINEINDITASILGEDVYMKQERFDVMHPLIVVIPPDRIYEYDKFMTCLECGGSTDMCGHCGDCEF